MEDIPTDLPPLPKESKLKLAVEGGNVRITTAGNTGGRLGRRWGLGFMLLGAGVVVGVAIFAINWVLAFPGAHAGALDWVIYTVMVLAAVAVCGAFVFGGGGLAWLGYLILRAGCWRREEMIVTPADIRSRVRVRREGRDWLSEESEARMRESGWIYDRAVALADVTAVEVRPATGDQGMGGSGVRAVAIAGGEELVEYGAGLSRRDQEWLCRFIRTVTQSVGARPPQ